MVTPDAEEGTGVLGMEVAAESEAVALVVPELGSSISVPVPITVAQPPWSSGVDG